MEKVEFLKLYLSLYIDHFKVLNAIKSQNSSLAVLDIRNAPKQIKKEQIKGAISMPVKEMPSHLNELDKAKTYVVYDWTGGSVLGKQALLLLLSAGFTAYELAGAFEGWKGMSLPVEPV